MKETIFEQKGLLFHASYLPSLPTILKYGLATQFHFETSPLKDGTLHGFDKKTNGCPCNQEIPQDMVHLRLPGVIYFRVTGNADYRWEGKVFRDKPRDFVDGYHFGVFTDPRSFLDDFPETREQEFKAFLGEPKAVERERLRQYYEYIFAEMRSTLLGTDYYYGTEFWMASCIPWNKFTAIVLSDNPPENFYSTFLGKIISYPGLTKKKVLEDLVGMMEKEKSKEERIPIFDISENLLYP